MKVKRISKWTYINSLLLPNLASDESMAIDVQEGDNGIDAMDQASLTNCLSILPSSVAGNKECYDTYMYKYT